MPFCCVLICCRYIITFEGLMIIQLPRFFKVGSLALGRTKATVMESVTLGSGTASYITGPSTGRSTAYVVSHHGKHQRLSGMDK